MRSENTILQDEVRDKIIKIAALIFSKYGFSKTTVDEIAKAARKGKSTIYYYFKSKEDIFQAVVEKEANPNYYAMMIDRYLMENKKKQLYGTQLRGKTEVVNGEFVAKDYYLYTLEDEPNVNKRRAELGLKPLEEELKTKWGIDYVVPLK